jgi:hypothetical protein
MFRIIRLLFIIVFTLLGVASCSPPAVGMMPASPTLTWTDTLPHPTRIPTQPAAAPTETRLPFTGYIYQGDYCQPLWSSFRLPYSDVQELSEDEIVGKLMELYFAYFLDPQAPDQCRIDGFTIDEVIDNERTQFMYVLSEYPNCDFTRIVSFSIQQKQDWLHKREYIVVLHYSSFYEMRFLRP